MTPEKKSLLGWAVGIAFFAMIVATGFQANAPKFGSIDMNRLIQESKMGQRNTTRLTNAFKNRQAVLAYIEDNAILTMQQATRLRELGTKETLTEAEKQEQEKIKGEVATSVKQYNDLVAKANPTAQETNILTDYNQRIDLMRDVLQQFGNEFQQEIQNLQTQVRDEERAKAREALNEVSKQQGYTVVFESQVAPFSANDVTDAAIKALDAKTPN